MPNPIKLRTGSTEPVATNFVVSEPAWDSANGNLYIKTDAGVMQHVGPRVMAYSSLSAFPSSPPFPAQGVLFIALDTSRLYRFVGANTYVEAGPPGGSGVDKLTPYFLPTAPATLSGTVGPAQVSLSWSASSAIAQIPVTDYAVQYSSDSGASWASVTRTPSTALSQVVTGLTPGTTYRFRVAGVSGIGQGAWSAMSAALTAGAAVTVDALIVGGGGSGGSGYTYDGAGGGAGGYRRQNGIVLSPGVTYSIAVGAGGAAVAGGANAGAGSSFANFTSLGGGKGAASSSLGLYAPTVGGAGGGASGVSGTGAAGTTGQGFAGGNSSATGPRAGGGGGAGTPGAAGAATTVAYQGGGSGGSGLADSITGTAVYRAGGGGAAQGGLGGAGGGGRGGKQSSVDSLNGVAGTANTGSGGGGGGGTTGVGGAGGSGTVIVSSPVPAVATTGTVVPWPTSGGRYIYQFNSTGSIRF